MSHQKIIIVISSTTIVTGYLMKVLNLLIQLAVLAYAGHKELLYVLVDNNKIPVAQTYHSGKSVMTE